MSARVADVMTTNVVAVRKSASLKEIASRLRELRGSAFPVLDDDGIVAGMVSETDLMPKEALVAGYEGHPGLSGLRHRGELGAPGGRGRRA
jgi:CBS-domain-containing membrane protein